jgi:hypothetical protein
LTPMGVKFGIRIDGFTTWIALKVSLRARPSLE